MRKPWKEAGLGLLNLFFVVLVVILAQRLLRNHLPQVGSGAVLAIIVLATYLAASKWIERRTPSELNPARLLPETGIGLVLGFALFSAVMVVLWMVRVYHPSGQGTASGLATGFVFAVLAGVLEEILFRGLLFRLSSLIVGTWGALTFTAIFFGAAHAFNPGASFFSSLAIAIEAGILLGAAYAATQRLWVPIGLHIGWNFTEGSIYTMSISGTGTKSGLILGSLTGPPILTGGQFGPEASMVAVLVCLAAALYFLRSTVKKNLVAPPVWSRNISDG